MTISRVVCAFIAALLLQGGAFAFYYGDLLYLRRPVADIASGAPGTFARHAADALKRPKLTQQHLETIAAAAERFRLHGLEIHALDRRTAEDPRDRTVRLRLADALRRAGDYSRAERIYSEILESVRKDAP